MPQFSRLAAAALTAAATFCFALPAPARAAAAEAEQAGKPPKQAAGPRYLSIPGYYMLQTEQARKELKLTDGQQKKLQEIAQQYYQQMRSSWTGLGKLSAEERKKKLEEYRRMNAQRMEAVRKQVEQLLSTDQLSGLKKLNLRSRGPYLLRSPQVLKQIEATDEQKQKIRELQQQLQERIRRLQKKTFEKTLDVLTPEQRKRLEEIGGRGYGATYAPVRSPQKK